MPIYMPLMGGHHVGHPVKPIGPWEKGGPIWKRYSLVFIQKFQKKFWYNFKIDLNYFFQNSNFLIQPTIYIKVTLDYILHRG